MVDPHADSIELVPSRHEEWRHAFESERDRVIGVLESSGLDRHLDRIEHIGSTAVADLPAKDIVDLDIVVSDQAVGAASSAIATELGGGRYENAAGWHPVFREHAGQRFNDHVFGHSHDGWKISVVTRDVLRARDDLRARYAALKRDLEAEHDELVPYSEAKSPFMDELLRTARTDARFAYAFDIPVRE